MKLLHWCGLLMIFGALALLGCAQQTSNQNDKDKDAEHKDGKDKHAEHKDEKVKHAEHKDGAKAHEEIKVALAKLSPEDLKLAEAQKTCPITNEPLGSMGTPLKVMVKDQAVLLCCKGCEKSALAHAEKTLAKVKELKAKSQK